MNGSYCHVIVDVDMFSEYDAEWPDYLNDTVSKLQGYGAKEVKCDCGNPQDIHMDCWIPTEFLNDIKALHNVTVVS